MNQKEKLEHHKKLIDLETVISVYEQDLATGKHTTVFPGDFFISADISLDYVYYTASIVISVDVENNNVKYLQYTRDESDEFSQIDSIELCGKSSYTFWIWRHETELRSTYTYNDLDKEFWHFRT